MPELKMPDINNVLIAGNVTSEISMRKTNSGTSVANFFIASHRKYRDNSGIWRENICNVGVVAWHKLAETCHDVLNVGSSILIDGELTSRTWKADDGSSKSVVEIRARRIQFLEQGLTKELEELSGSERSDDSEKPQDSGSPAKHSDMTEVEPTDYDFGYQNLKI